MSAPTAQPAGSAPLKLTVAPRYDHELPKLFASDALTGGTFKAKREALELLCDQILGADREWQLQSDELLVDWGHFRPPSERAAAAADGEGSDAQALACSFLCLRILVAPRANPKDTHVVVTHLFVDHVWAMIFARELFGFPALFATFETRDSGGVVVKLDGDQLDAKRTVAELEWETPSGSLPPPPDSFWEMIRARPSETALRTIPFVQVKQMRDGLDATRACYQGPVQGQVRIDLPNMDVHTADLTLTLDDQVLLPDSDLGLKSPAKSSSGYRTRAVTLSVKVQSPAQSPIVRNGRSGGTFRQRSGDAQAAPPYLFTGVDIVGFRLPVAHELLQAVCDTWLNDPFPGRSYRYVPANVDLVVECLNYPDMKSENPPFGRSKDDATSQRELVFRMLVGRVDDDGRAIRAPAVFCPFVFVNSVWSMVSGREVIGYPKLLATFSDFPLPNQRFDACKINAVTPTLHSRERPLMTIDCRFERTPRDVEALFAPMAASSGQKDAPPGTEMPSDSVWWGLAELQSGGADPDTFTQPWLNGQLYGYAGLQVKRFNDARNLRDECYQEIVECDYTLLKAAVSLPLHDATLHFPEDDVYGIAAAFGFAPVVPVPPGSWYRTKADFAFNVTDPLA